MVISIFEEHIICHKFHSREQREAKTAKGLVKDKGEKSVNGI